ncbi:MAG: glycosyl hydrolase family 18 protein [Clostridiaceae bacterium]|nr:glycosyl hydrolase family 18 protein [Clostridiaceae bacterium]
MKKKKIILVSAAFVVIVLLVAAGIYFYQKFSPNTEKMELADYFKNEDGELALVVEDEILEEKGRYHDGQAYVGFDLVQELFNSRFYWDSNENLLLYTTSSAVIKTEPGTKDYYQNNSKQTKEYEIVYREDDSIYIALDYVQDYTALEYAFYEDPDRIVITCEYDQEKDYTNTDTDCALRVNPDIKAKILVDLQEGTKLRLLDAEDEETGFCKVMEETGVVGYVKAKYLQTVYQETDTTDFAEEDYTHILKEEKISLVWHQVTNQTANTGLLNLLSETKGVNVVSPTWFETSDNEGNISSLASDTYVTQAHQNGVDVWGLCDDFSPNMKIGKVLGYTSRRQKLAKNLVAEAIRYSLDGINIDFENVKQDSGEDFIQFIRELGIMCRNNGIVLSIDNYPLRDYNEYYDRTEQANVADYVITMAYDEYYSGSEEAGPVSSLSYVEDATAGVLEQVPAEQAVIALPFYSRHWKEKTKDGEVVLDSEACSMSYAKQIVEDSGQETVWDEDTSMNYLEYTEDGVIHKLWLEDITSLEAKLKAVYEQETAGAAFWKLGMEESSVWDMIVRYYP